MQKRVKRIIFALLILIWMITIFCFSNEQSEESSRTSEGIIKTTLNKFESYNNLNEDEQNEIVERLQHPIRKLAHFTIYMVGGIIIFCFNDTFNYPNRKKVVITIVIACIYAITDEIHQLFVSGRSGQVSDVLLDTVGASIGTIIIFIKNKWRRIKDVK